MKRPSFATYQYTNYLASILLRIRRGFSFYNSLVTSQWWYPFVVKLFFNQSCLTSDEMSPRSQNSLLFCFIKSFEIDGGISKTPKSLAWLSFDAEVLVWLYCNFRSLESRHGYGCSSRSNEYVSWCNCRLVRTRVGQPRETFEFEVL